MDIILPLLALSGLALFSKPKSSSSSSGNFKNGQYVPTRQLSFKTKLNSILIDLENKLEIEDLRDFFMGVAWVESKYFPSAIKYENTGYIGVENNPTRFKNNKWKNKKEYFNFTGGLFQLFPSTALSATGAVNNSPLTVFDPYYTIVYGIDLASRLNKSYNVKNWFDVRLGWHSLKLLKDKTPEILLEVENRIVNGINKSGGDSEILYKYLPDNFDKYRSDFGFKKLLKYTLSLK